jgi:hypothetical protein
MTITLEELIEQIGEKPKNTRGYQKPIIFHELDKQGNHLQRIVGGSPELQLWIADVLGYGESLLVLIKEHLKKNGSITIKKYKPKVHYDISTKRQTMVLCGMDLAELMDKRAWKVTCKSCLKRM